MRDGFITGKVTAEREREREREREDGCLNAMTALERLLH